jgi:hypothetical protein
LGEAGIIAGREATEYEKEKEDKKYGDLGEKAQESRS